MLNKWLLFSIVAVIVCVAGLSMVRGEETKKDVKDGIQNDRGNAAIKEYRVVKTDDFQISGGGDNPAWKRAAWCRLDANHRAGSGDRVSRFKMLYSDRGLYVLMDAEDQTLSATKTADFDNLWTEDVLEFFLWPDERWPVYFEYEISPLARELALLVPNFGGHAKQHGWRPWHYEGDRRIQKAVAVRGGRPRPGATITGWSAEVFVPYTLLKPLQNVPPRPGARWRANVYRCDYDGGRQNSWQWSPTGESFHDYNNFGTLVFE